MGINSQSKCLMSQVLRDLWVCRQRTENRALSSTGRETTCATRFHNPQKRGWPSWSASQRLAKLHPQPASIVLILGYRGVSQLLCSRLSIPISFNAQPVSDRAVLACAVCDRSLQIRGHLPACLCR